MTIEHGTPLFLGKPHFLDAEQSLINSIFGLNPIKELHDTYFDIEPISGIVMDTAERFQINLMMSKTDIRYKDCCEGIMPILWLEFGGRITEDLANRFKNLVYGTQNLSENLFQGLNALAATLIIPGAIITTIQNRKRLDAKEIQQGKKSIKQNIVKSNPNNSNQDLDDGTIRSDKPTEISENLEDLSEEAEEDTQ